VKKVPLGRDVFGVLGFSFVSSPYPNFIHQPSTLYSQRN